jgi:hypothetical protein
MRLFWKIISEIYCELVSWGLNFKPPSVLFHQPEQKFQCQYFEEILADKSFTDAERTYIMQGLQDIEEFCNGLYKFTVNFVLEPTTEVAVSSCLLLKVKNDNPLIVASDERIKSTTLGLCQYMNTGAKIVYLAHERLTDAITYRTTVAHEFGHFIGLEHTERVSIMHKSNFGNVLFPTYIDALEFAKKYNCNPEDLKYFKL